MISFLPGPIDIIDILVSRKSSIYSIYSRHSKGNILSSQETSGLFKNKETVSLDEI